MRLLQPHWTVGGLPCDAGRRSSCRATRSSLSREHWSSPFQPDHGTRVPSLGYVVWERRQEAQARVWQGLSGEEIRDRRLSGRGSDQRDAAAAEWPTLGDSTPEAGLDICPAMYQAEGAHHGVDVRVAPRHRKRAESTSSGTCTSTTCPRAPRAGSPTNWSSPRTSARAIIAGQIRHYVQKALPDMLDGRMQLWI